MMPTLDEQYEDLYGPLASYSDYKRGEKIAYRVAGAICTGTIVWISAPTEIAGQGIPCQYIVESDQRAGVPDAVLLGQIVIEREAPTMPENQQDASILDTAARPFKTWLRARLRHARRDAIDNLAKHLLEDHRIPHSGSRSLYLAHLRAKRYAEQDIQALGDAWREMFEQRKEDQP